MAEVVPGAGLAHQALRRFGRQAKQIDRPGLSDPSFDASSSTPPGWYLNPYAKRLFNWVHFNGTNSPLDPVGTRTEGDALATRRHVDF